MLQNVRHVLELAKSLVSTGQLDDLGYKTIFGNQSWTIKKGNLVISRVKHGSLYSMHVSCVKDNVIAIAKLRSTELWHSRLGHMSQKGMKTLERFGYLPVLSFSDFSICEHCIYGKQTRSVHLPIDRKCLEPLKLVHSDVCGPMPSKSLGGASYFVTFIDDSTRKVWVYPLKSKDEVFSTFQKFLALVENQSGKKLKGLRTDNGGEYLSREMVDFCAKRGIRHGNLLLLTHLLKMELLSE